MKWDYQNKKESDGLKKIEVWWLKKNGYLNGWRLVGIEWPNSSLTNKESIGMEISTDNGDDYLRLHYATIGSKINEIKNLDYRVDLTTTKCYLGGKRYWFYCPSCGRRIGILYKLGEYFACRICHKLTYRSNNYNKRSKNYYLVKLLNNYNKADKLEENIKRPLYKNKITKKFKRIIKIYDKTRPYKVLLKKKKSGIL